MRLSAALRRASALRACQLPLLSALPWLPAHARFYATATSTGSGGESVRSDADAASDSNSNHTGPASSTNAAVSFDVPPPRRESRFVRGGNAATTTDAALSENGAVPSPAAPLPGEATAGSATATDVATSMVRLSLPREMRAARALVVYLQRAQGTLHRHPGNLALAAVARYELQKVLFPSLKGLDVPNISLLLQTLRFVEMPVSAPLLQDAVTWLSLFGQRMPLSQYVKMLELLLYFRCSGAVRELVSSLPHRLSESEVPSLSPSQTVVLLTALLPALKFTENAAGAMGGNTERDAAERAVSLDIALRSMAIQLRDRCKGHGYVSVDPALLAHLLRALWAAQSTRDWRHAQGAGEWTSLAEATCHILASASTSENLSLTATVELLSELSNSEVADAAMLESGITAGAAREALFAALQTRLDAAVEELHNASSGLASKAELPPPWTPRDVRSVWRQALESAHAPTHGIFVVKSAKAESALRQTYRDCLTKAQSVLSNALTTLLQCHTEDLGVSEMVLAAVRAGVAAAEESAAYSRTETLHDASTAAPSAPTTDAEDGAYTDLSAIFPAALVEIVRASVQRQLQKPFIEWTPSTVQDVTFVLVRSADAAHRDLALQLAKRWYTQLQARAQNGERLQPQDLLAFFVPPLLRQERAGVLAAVTASLSRWSVSEVLYFFSRLGSEEGRGRATAGGLESAAVLRDAGKSLCAYASMASAAQLAALVECFGVAHVRNDDFCEAAVKRLAELLDATLIGAVRHSTYDSLHPYGTAEREANENAGAHTGQASSFAGAAGSGAEAPSSSSPSGSIDTTTAASGKSNTSGPVAGVAAVVTLAQLTQFLRSFALMESRQIKPFIDAAPYVMQAADANEGTPEEITQLLAAYAKMLIWNYPVFRSLAERLCRCSPEEVSLRNWVTAQLALLRMDVTLTSVTTGFYAALIDTYGPADNETSAESNKSLRNKVEVELNEAVMQLSLLSRLSTRCPGVPTPDPSVRAALTRAILEHAKALRVEELAELLSSLARIGEGRSAAFDELTVQTLGVLPTAAPRVMAHIAEAYALAGRGDDTELFTVIADRTMALRHDMAAVTIARVLAAFAKVNVRNDRLFIEVIPRVRHVATYGTPRDVVNVVSAYAAMSLWHYKLFARLADRAIQLRADFRVGELVRLLHAYATVQMRYDSLFLELGPRIQTLAHLLSPADLASIVSSYSQLNIPCLPVWKATAARAVSVADLFTEEQAGQLLDAYATQNYYPAECVQALTRRFPALESIPFEVPEDGAEGGDQAGDRAAVKDAN